MMKNNLLLILVLFSLCNITYSQSIQSNSKKFTGSSQFRNNGGTFTYELTTSAKATRVTSSPGSVILKPQASQMKITSFSFKGIEASSLGTISFPITVKANWLDFIDLVVSFEYKGNSFNANLNQMSQTTIQNWSSAMKQLKLDCDPTFNYSCIPSANDFKNIRLVLNNASIPNGTYNRFAETDKVIDAINKHIIAQNQNNTSQTENNNNSNYSNQRKTAENYMKESGMKTAEQIYAEHQKNMNIQSTGYSLISQGDYMQAAQHYASNGYAVEAYTSAGLQVVSDVVNVIQQNKVNKINNKISNLKNALTNLNELNGKIPSLLENKDYKGFIKLDDKIIAQEKRVLEDANWLNKKTDKNYTDLIDEIKKAYQQRVTQSMNYVTNYFLKDINQSSNNEALDVFWNAIETIHDKILDENDKNIIQNQKNVLWKMMFGLNNENKPILSDYYKCKLFYTTSFYDDEIENLLNKEEISIKERYIMFTYVYQNGTDNKLADFLKDFDINLYYSTQNIFQDLKKGEPLHKLLSINLYHYDKTTEFIKQKLKEIKKNTGLKNRELYEKRKNIGNLKLMDFEKDIEKLSKCLSTEESTKNCQAISEDLLSTYNNLVSKSQIYFSLGKRIYENDNENLTKEYFEKALNLSKNKSILAQKIGVFYNDNAIEKMHILYTSEGNNDDNNSVEYGTEEYKKMLEKLNSKEYQNKLKEKRKIFNAKLNAVKEKRLKDLESALVYLKQSYDLITNSETEWLIKEIKINLGLLEYKPIKGLKSKKDDPNIQFIAPQFPGGKKGLIEYITNNILSNIKGKAKIDFYISDDGKTIAHPFWSETSEILNVIRAICEFIPSWKPATENGKPITYSFRIPITIDNE